ncbi:MAG TPA: hypothetical protein VEZ59_02135 [Sphingopyxis sp.]|nr:hypothetical protein [Sphingopyxis sp.]
MRSTASIIGFNTISVCASCAVFAAARRASNSAQRAVASSVRSMIIASCIIHLLSIAALHRGVTRIRQIAA